MYDVVAVGVAQRARHFSSDPERLVERQLALALEPFPEGFALDVRHDVVQEALGLAGVVERQDVGDRKSTRLNSSHLVISYAVFCLKTKKDGVACSEHTAT